MDRPNSRPTPHITVTYGSQGDRHRRLRTSEAYTVVNVAEILAQLPPDRRPLLELLTLYLDVEAAKWRLIPPGLSVRFTAHEQHRGKRYYFLCPLSGRRASKLYVVKTTQGWLVGSAKGLGLSYPSQALHKTPALDTAILSFRPTVQSSVFARAMIRDGERYRRALKRFLR